MAEPAPGTPALRGPLPFLVVLAAIVWLFVSLPLWRPTPAPSGQSYALAPSQFEAKVAEQVKAYATGELARFAGEDAEGIPVVHPPPGDVYVLARRWQFWPFLELEDGKTYRLHLASVDILHGLALGEADRLLAPGQVAVVTVTPRAGEPLVLQCSEFCGLRHNRMKATVRVVPAR